MKNRVVMNNNEVHKRMNFQVELEVWSLQDVSIYQAEGDQYKDAVGLHYGKCRILTYSGDL